MSALQLAIVKYAYFLSLFIRVMHHFHILKFMNFVLFHLKFIKFKLKIKFMQFELHNYGFTYPDIRYYTAIQELHVKR